MRGSIVGVRIVGIEFDRSPIFFFRSVPVPAEDFVDFSHNGVRIGQCRIEG